MATKLQSQPSLCVPPRPDIEDEFWSLFNPWQFLKAFPASHGERPDWKAVKKYPVSKRLAESGWLVAVRPSSTTMYIVVDIDFQSRYHPDNQPYAIQSILQCFEEDLGLCAPILIRSSDSGGIHIWYWFHEPQNAYHLADATRTVLQRRGFVIQPGQLELFPNCKTWIDSNDPQDWSLYNALRIPFQEPGSFLLDQCDFTPLLSAWGDQRQEFTRLVKFTRNRNTLSAERISSILANRPKYHKVLTATANKYLNDLLTKVNLGWTGYGQTQQIFFDVTRLLRIFGHILLGCDPLWNVDRLAKEIYQYVLALPERQTWCKHNHELEKMAQRWAAWVQKTKYKPYGRNVILPETDLSSSSVSNLAWNQKKSLDARERISKAFEHLKGQGALPETTTARANALVKQGISFSTLYRHPDLWHPKHLAGSTQPAAEVKLHSIPQPPVENSTKSLQDNVLQTSTAKESFTTEDERVATSLARLLGSFDFQGVKGELKAPPIKNPQEGAPDSVSIELPQEPQMPRSHQQPSPESQMPDFNPKPSPEQSDSSQYQYDDWREIDALDSDEWERAFEEKTKRDVAAYRQEILAANPVLARSLRPSFMNLEAWYWTLILEGQYELETSIELLGKKYSSHLECCQKIVEAEISETEDLQQDLRRMGSLIPKAWGGDWDNFPAEDADTVQKKRMAMALEGKYYMPKMEALMKIAFLQPEEFMEVTAAVKVRSNLLQWSAAQLHSFIEENFMGKTRQQLTMFELLVLLYDLEVHSFIPVRRKISWTDTEY